MVRLVLLGPPGAGKGTQAQKLSQELGIPHISTGVILREAAEKGTEMGRRAKEVMDRGELVSDEIMLGIMRDRLQDEDCRPGYILDGFPRTIPQAQALDEILNKTSTPPVLVANLELDEEELRKRIATRRSQVSRSDDAEETVLSRFRVYQEKTRPLLDYYGRRVRPLEGAGTVPEIFDRLKELILSTAGRGSEEAR